MTAATNPDLGVFLTIIDQWPAGSLITVESLRDDLEAAQIRPTAYGSLFRSAVERGHLRPTGTATRCHKPSRRGGYALVYTVIAGEKHR